MTTRAALTLGETIPTLAKDSGILKIVTCLAWENIPNPIICVGALRSYPFPFVLIMHSYTYIHTYIQEGIRVVVSIA